jgi:hypothetical protein
VNLVDRITAASMTPAKGGDMAPGMEFTDPGSWGALPGAFEQLSPQPPPIATSHGWGDLLWLYFPSGGGY